MRIKKEGNEKRIRILKDILGIFVFGFIVYISISKLDVIKRDVTNFVMSILESPPIVKFYFLGVVTGIVFTLVILKLVREKKDPVIIGNIDNIVVKKPINN